MKQAYSNISLATGIHNAGICNIKIAPREWVINLITVDFVTGFIKAPISFIAGKEWLKIDLIPNTVEHEEKPKISRAGHYYEKTFGGTSNNLSPELYKSITTLLEHEFIILYTNVRGEKKLIGNNKVGNILQVTFTEENKNNALSIGFSFTMDEENLSHYYPF